MKGQCLAESEARCPVDLCPVQHCRQLVPSKKTDLFLAAVNAVSLLLALSETVLRETLPHH